MTAFLLRFGVYLMGGLCVGAGGWLLVSEAPSLSLLGIGLTVIGLLISLGLIRAASAAPLADGIQTSPASVVYLMDAVVLIASALAFFFLIDGWAERVDTGRSTFREPLVADVIAFMLLPSGAFLTWFVTSSGSQSIQVTATDIRLYGAFGSHSAAWGDVVSIRSSEQYIIVSRVGFLMPKRLRTNLLFETAEGQTLTLFEPASRATKEQVLALLRAYSPERLQEMLTTVAQEWI